MSDGDYQRCSYCGRKIFADVAECPYCHNYTDGKGPLGPNPEKRLPRAFVIAAWLVVLGMLLPILWVLASFLSR